MRQRLTPDHLRLALWAGCLTYCAAMWCWLRIDQARNPNPWPAP